jgi:hypothetical protein
MKYTSDFPVPRNVPGSTVVPYHGINAIFIRR